MKKNDTFNGLWIGKLSQANSWYHIYPFALANHTSLLHVVRYGLPFYEVPNSQFYHYKAANPLVEFLKLYRCGRKVIKRNKIDYIITFNPYPWGIVAWILSKQFSIPVSIGLIGKDFDIGLKKSWYRKLLRYILRKSDYVTITGNAMRPYLESIGIQSNRVGIYPHCIKDDWFNKTDDDAVIEYDIITTCELIERKRVKDIIQSVQILKQKNYKIRFCIVGDGPLMNSLKELTKSMGLEENIHFTGYKKDVLYYLKRSNIYVQASRQEGLSISLVEAMAAGLVPVSTIAGSEEDIIENSKNGFLVTIGSPQEIADAIEILLRKDNFEKYKREVLKSRNRFRMTEAIETADKIIERLAAK